MKGAKLPWAALAVSITVVCLAFFLKITEEIRVDRGELVKGIPTVVRVFLSDSDRNKISSKSVNLFEVPCSSDEVKGDDLGYMADPYPLERHSGVYILVNLRNFETWMKPKPSHNQAEFRLLRGDGCAYIASQKDYGLYLYRSNIFRVSIPGVTGSGR